MPSWEDLDKRETRQPRPDEFAEVSARLLSTMDGRRWVDMLREMTIEADLRDGLPESALWKLEGGRQLVRRIQKATQKGLDMLENR